MKWRYKAFLTCLILLLFFVWAEVARSPKSENGVQLFFFDVGQGDSALIEKGDYQILIDGGPDDVVLSELGKAMPLADRRIEIVILSHPHADHLAGLNQVLDRYQVGQIYYSGATYTSDGYLSFLDKIKSKNITVSVPAIGEKVEMYGNAKLEFLWPGDQYKDKTIENLNNSSLVERFCYFDWCALMTGDIEIDEQAKMFMFYAQAGTAQFKSEILKLPHHGSSNGSNDQLFSIVQPNYAIISAGADNKYGHPHKSSLDLAEKYKSQILRTDRDGTIQFTLGQEGIMLIK